VPTTVQTAALRAVRRRILAWYRSDHRDLPFRRSRDPWPVLVAEVMLQQTQASRVSDRFEAFLDRYPTADAMAAAAPATVLATWSGLGYNRRALNLHAAAAQITASGWPDTIAGLEGLPGIGPYSARAIASIAFGQSVGAVDTNVRRWLVRRFGADPADRRGLQELADRLAAAASPAAAATTTTGEPREVAAWTHATMEFGGLVCTARAPRCRTCPVSRGCPSRSSPRHVPVPRQPASTAATRMARGALLQALTNAPGHRLGERDARRAVAVAAPSLDYERLTAGLARDRLLHRSGRGLVLGPR
jgi:A/G-specific adenine glycosylase